MLLDYLAFYVHDVARTNHNSKSSANLLLRDSSSDSDTSYCLAEINRLLEAKRRFQDSFQRRETSTEGLGNEETVEKCSDAAAEEQAEKGMASLRLKLPSHNPVFKLSSLNTVSEVKERPSSTELDSPVDLAVRNKPIEQLQQQQQTLSGTGSGAGSPSHTRATATAMASQVFTQSAELRSVTVMFIKIDTIDLTLLEDEDVEELDLIMSSKSGSNAYHSSAYGHQQNAGLSLLHHNNKNHSNSHSTSNTSNRERSEPGIDLLSSKPSLQQDDGPPPILDMAAEERQLDQFFGFLDRSSKVKAADELLLERLQTCFVILHKAIYGNGGQLRQFIVDDKGTVCIASKLFCYFSLNYVYSRFMLFF